MADRVGAMNQVRLEQISAPTDVYAHPATPFVAEFVGLRADFHLAEVDDGEQLAGAFPIPIETSPKRAAAQKTASPTQPRRYVVEHGSGHEFHR